MRIQDDGEYFCLVNNKVEGQDRVGVEVVSEQEEVEKEEMEENFSASVVDSEIHNCYC